MKPYYEHASVTILHGDVLACLREFPEESVNCVVTSPPYWGLRDYGTASWEGGESGCDHRQAAIRMRNNLAAAANASDGGNRQQGSRADNDLGIPYRETCGKCGAVRVDAQIGLEKTPQEYVAKMVEVFREVRRVLRKDGTCWVNLGDSYANDGKWGGETGGKQSYLDDNNRKRVGREKRHTGLKAKDLCGIPWRVAFALQEDGWWLRQDIIWAKPNPMPESVTDRCTKSHEYLFLLTKSAKYYFDAEAIKEDCAESSILRWDQDIDSHPSERTAGNKSHKTVAEYERGESEEHRTAAGLLKIADTAYPKRNKRDVWEIAAQPYSEAHFATFPEKLVEPCILAGCPAGGVVLDPFGGSMTTLLIAQRLNCKGIAIELNAEYIEIGMKRFCQDVFGFAETSA